MSSHAASALAAGLTVLGLLLAAWHPRPAPLTASTAAARAPRRLPALGPASAAAAAAASALLLGAAPLLTPTIALVAWAVARTLARSRREQQAVRRRSRLVEACEAMLGDLHAGRPPGQALVSAARACPELTAAAGTVALGGDVPSALRTVARAPGAEAVDRVAGAWQLCAATGSGLALALEQVLATVRAEQEVTLAVRGELASARATARLLAVLPLLVLVMAQGIGADPWAFLLATAPGLLCLGAGVGLAVAGVTWLDRIADEAQAGGA